MDEEKNIWMKSIHDLESVYRDVELRSLSLPAFSISPFIIAVWNSIKFGLWLDIDVYLIIPINVIVFIRNLFPGKWRYRFFSWPYIKYVAQWIWRGEAPTTPFFFLKMLTTSMLYTHFRNRFQLLRRRILLEGSISSESRTVLLSEIDQNLARWPDRSILSFLYTYLLPASGLLIEGYKLLINPQKLPPWAGSIALYVAGYVFSIYVSAFLMKRGLMLGASGRTCYFPGSLDGQGVYAEEKRIFKSLDLVKTEFPIDIFFALIWMPLGYFQAKQMSMSNSIYGIELPNTTFSQSMQQYETIFIIVPFILSVLLNGFSYFRRRILQRQ